jgi:Flp pilus assembly protein TadG
VEFAIAVPVLFVFIFGLVEVGRAFIVSELLAHAAGLGARAGAVGSGSTEQARAAAAQVLTDSGVRGATIQVLVGGSAGEAASARPGETVSVAISVSYANVSWLPSSSYLSGATLSARASAWKE